MKMMVFEEKKRIWCGLPCTFTKYICDEEKLTIKSGFFVQREDEIKLYRILDVGLSRSLLQKMFKLGNVEVHTADKTAGCFVMKNIKHSREVKDALSDAVEAERERVKIASREFIVDGDN